MFLAAEFNFLFPKKWPMNRVSGLSLSSSSFSNHSNEHNSVRLDVAVASTDQNIAEKPDQVSPQNDEPSANSSDGPTIAKIEDVITLDPESDVLDLNHARIGKIEHLEGMLKLERLYLRWNLLKKIENLDTLTGLVEVELYDNQITEIENLDKLVNLE